VFDNTAFYEQIQDSVDGHAIEVFRSFDGFENLLSAERAVVVVKNSNTFNRLGV
jgi:hypothetical protein